MERQPTLLSSCARAATSAEAAFRINAPAFTRRSSRVIALDGQAAAVIRELAGRTWNGGHFLLFESAVPDDALLRRASDGGTALLSEELDGADTVVMIASAHVNAEAASIIGDAAAARAIMSAGLVLPGVGPDGARPDGPGEADAGRAGRAGRAVAALRPNAMVLVIVQDAADVPEVLSALRV